MPLFFLKFQDFEPFGIKDTSFQEYSQKNSKEFDVTTSSCVYVTTIEQEKHAQHSLEAHHCRRIAIM